MRTPLLVLCAAAVLAGCGFQLQGKVPLSRALSVTYIDTEDAQYEAVTGDEVRAVAARQFELGRHVVCVVRPDPAAGEA